jgi:hypothetical protein
MSSSALAELTAGFEEPFARLGMDAEEDRSAVVISWPSVPVEIVRAAGLRPVVARGSAAPTPEAAAVLEAGVFPSRLHRLVDAVLSGRLAHAAAVVLPRTSDPDYKCFLYLRELARRGVATRAPPVLLFDLLQSSGADVPEYDVERARELLGSLAKLSDRRADLRELDAQIALANRARAAARRLDALRRHAPRVAGAEALPLLGAFWQLPSERYAALATTAAESIAARSALTAPRVLLAGTPVDSTVLHSAIEAEGAVVVAELSPFGSGVARGAVGASLASLVEHYRESLTARMPVAALLGRIEQALDGVDAVVVSLPADDASFGWDYPRIRELLGTKSVPHTVLEGDPSSPTPVDRERIAALVAKLPRQREARGG